MTHPIPLLLLLAALVLLAYLAGSFYPITRLARLCWAILISMYRAALDVMPFPARCWGRKARFTVCEILLMLLMPAGVSIGLLAWEFADPMVVYSLRFWIPVVGAATSGAVAVYFLRVLLHFGSRNATSHCYITLSHIAEGKLDRVAQFLKWYVSRAQIDAWTVADLGRGQNERDLVQDFERLRGLARDLHAHVTGAPAILSAPSVTPVRPESAPSTQPAAVSLHE